MDVPRGYDNVKRTGEASIEPCLLEIRDLIYQIAGIYETDNRLRLLEEHCQTRMQEVGATSLHEYYEMLTIRPDRTLEMHKLLDEITIGETSFFRNMPQLDALQKLVLPMIVSNKERFPVKTIRVWSAGCSTGEEPHTLAMLLMEHSDGLLKGWDFEVIATDLNTRSLARAQKGLYSESAMRNMPVYFRSNYGTNVGDEWQVNDAVRAKINFSRLNLLDDSRMAFLKGIDIVFCCNVLIYFDSASKRKVIQHFYNNLLTNSYLFLGHSESLFGVNEDFRLVHLPGATAYLKTGQRFAGGI